MLCPDPQIIGNDSNRHISSVSPSPTRAIGDIVSLVCQLGYGVIDLVDKNQTIECLSRRINDTKRIAEWTGDISQCKGENCIFMNALCATISILSLK